MSLRKTQTDMCVHCLVRKAGSWTGYVKGQGRKWLMAGWCARCLKRHDAGKLRGFSGHYVEAMGRCAR